MERHHISIKPVTKVHAAKQTGDNFKPKGLWYEVDGDWRRWCASEQPDWIEGRYLYQVALNGERVLRVSNAKELDAFHDEYSVGISGSYYQIDWPRIASLYDGVEIAPYIWERRLSRNDMLWYYGWDCASGCLWRPRGVRLILEKAP